ncbi:MAG: VOC family protein [Candidatus Devosia phytovorans]|uniref:VOC family protein n=1 Tax=Candidatus Devosia phytovorans TaxID=3121372 RepID=A0AAJ5VWM5_9HYPH|nr:VOC family protein [Devosia sp.]WEK05446.1 MAG: VOC family protein [Devosia sp.]
MTSIMPCLWFNNRIDEAVEFYTTTFPEAKLLEEVRHDPNGPRFTAVIELAGHKFFLLNGSGSEPSSNPFTWAVSFMVECSGQDEVDYFWNSFVDNGGKPSMCGWCEDKFGLSWQVVPKQIYETVMGPDPAGARRATDAMMKMGKLIVADLQAAYRGD